MRETPTTERTHLERAVAAVATVAGREPELREVVLTPLQPDEVLVEVAASGVCHTDLTALDGAVPLALPAVLGHEGAGTVVAVGARVTAVAVGERVVMTFDACGACRRCREGHPASCAEFAARNYSGARPDGSATLTDESGARISGSWLGQSSWATHAIARETNVVPIGPDLPFVLAAPLGCGVLTGAGTVLNVLRPGHDDRVLVVGAGTVGLAAVMAARAVGVATITVVEPDEARRALAGELGADAAISPEEARELRGTHDLALDTVGTQAAIDLALGALVTPGACATVALRGGANRVTVSQTALLWGRSLTGVIEGDAEPAELIPRLVGLWRAGLFPLESLVTRVPFEDIGAAVAMTRGGEAVKAVLAMADAPPESTPPLALRVSAAERLRQIMADGTGRSWELAALWDVLPAARAATLTGLWRGVGIDTGHRIHRALVKASWYGKNFVDAAHVQPIVSRDVDGSLWANLALSGGGAWLSDQAHRGKVCATMTYDTRPVHDHFVSVDDDTVLGVMAGAGALDGGEPYYFVLERDRDAHPGAVPERSP
ncbi:alcohol dehydrogenase catalytic domain-containing protein [Demequina sp. NBRC 110056]|uniref:alcohol dehydrogenase catalytic domain-containing protein n=1 Tax=Demequina sp. NBRC 110056 TaxID=1570345 RepID=UPI00190E9A26|nr:alcohol dehydrogenase catalytic domain-containing protein [Demequina sp. NBRC 110056]